MKLIQRLSIYMLCFLVLACAFSCADDDGVEIFRMRVNHYTQPAIPGWSHGNQFFFVQVGDKIGSDEWSMFSQNIKGLDFELGYTYDLIVKQTPDDPNIADGPGAYYSAITTPHKTKVSANTTFELTVAYNGQIDTNYVVMDEGGNFKTLNDINIQCESLCDVFSENIAGLEEGKYAIGIFQHVNSNTIRLVDMGARIIGPH